MKKMRHGGRRNKVFFLASTAALAVGVAACGSSSSSGATTTSTPSKHFTIAYVPGATGVGFYNSLLAGIKTKAKSLGMSVVYQGAAAFSPSAQIPVVQGVCTNKPSLLILSPTDPVALEPAVQACIAAGIPVITTDTTLSNTSNIVAQITTNNAQGGKLAADFVGKALNGKGEVAVLSLSPTATTQVARVQSFESEIKSAYPNITIVATEYVGQEATSSESAVNALLLAHPNLGAVYGVAEPAAEGAAAALQSAGKTGKVVVVGFDAGASEVKLLQAGQVQALVAQLPTQEGQIAAQDAYDKLTGKTSAIQPTQQLQDVLLTTAESKLPSYAKYFYGT